MMPSLTRLRALLVNRASDPVVQQWHDEHANDRHTPCDRCGSTTALQLTTCLRCTFALCPRCYVKHLLMRSLSSDALCHAAVEWATFHAAIRSDIDDAAPTAEDFAAARTALRGYLR